MEGLDLNSLEFTPATTSPASSLVVWVKIDAKLWELLFEVARQLVFSHLRRELNEIQPW